MQFKISELSFFEFIRFADKDYIAARLLTFCGKSMWSVAAFHSHQALEKYMKAFLIQKIGKYPETHNLKELRKSSERFARLFQEKPIIDLIEKLDLPEQVVRYGPFANYDPLAKREKGKFVTKGVFVWSDSFIKDLDKLVYKIRNLIDFSQNKKSDGLKAILEEDIKHEFVKNWKLPVISIKKVLISDNDFFR